MPEEPTPPAGGQPAPPPEKTLTQAEVDAIVKERLTREREKYKDYDTLKQSAAKLAEIENAN